MTKKEEKPEEKKTTPIDKIAKVVEKVAEPIKEKPKDGITTDELNKKLKLDPKPVEKPKKRKNPNAGIAAKKRWAKVKKLEAAEAAKKKIVLDPLEPQKKEGWSTGKKIAFGMGFLAAFTVIAYTMFRVLDARKKNKELVETEGDFDEDLIEEDDNEETEEATE